MTTRVSTANPMTLTMGRARSGARRATSHPVTTPERGQDTVMDHDAGTDPQAHPQPAARGHVGEELPRTHGEEDEPRRAEQEASGPDVAGPGIHGSSGRLMNAPPGR